MLGGEKEELRRIPFFLKISSQLAKDLIFQQQEMMIRKRKKSFGWMGGDLGKPIHFCRIKENLVKLISAIFFICLSSPPCY
jgi:hypothetical protein